MDLPQVLHLPSRQARILRAIWFALPLVIIAECWLFMALAWRSRHSNAGFVSLLQAGSGIHTLALLFFLLPLVLWTAVFWWLHRSDS